MKRHQHQIKVAKEEMGYCFFEMWPRLPWRHCHLKKGNFTTRKLFSWTFSLIFSIGFTLSSDTTVNSFIYYVSSKKNYKVHLLSCVTSFQITCNMKDGLWTDNRKRSMRWVSHKWFGRVRLFWEELQVRVEAVSYTKLGLGEWVIEKLC